MSSYFWMFTTSDYIHLVQFEIKQLPGEIGLNLLDTTRAEK